MQKYAKFAIKGKRWAQSAALITGLMAGQAYAVTVGFDRITNNGSSDAAGQLSVEITDGTGADAGSAILEFSVSSGANTKANIAEIYFDDGPPPIFASPLTNANITGTTGTVAFTAGSAAPPELPGANDADPDFDTTNGMLADNGSGSANGITIGEALELTIAYASGQNFNALLSALASGQLRIGLHVRSLAGIAGPDCDKPLECESDSFVSSPVPLPAAAWLFLVGLASLAGTRWKARGAVAA